MYIVDFRYSAVGKTFETLDQAKDYADEQASYSGENSYILISELVEVRKVTVPVEVKTVTKQDLDTFLQDLNQKKEDRISCLNQ